MNNFSRLWGGGGAAPSHLELGPGVIRQRNSSRKFKSSIQEVVGGLGSGLVGSYMKGMFKSESFIIFRHWLARGGAFPPMSARPRHQSARNTDAKKA